MKQVWTTMMMMTIPIVATMMIRAMTGMIAMKEVTGINTRHVHTTAAVAVAPQKQASGADNDFKN
jgi:hypothetical protein